MPPSPLTPPTLRADLPVYPQLPQTLRVTAATVAGPAGVAQTAGSSVLAGIYYVAFTQQRRTDSGLLRDREPCLVQDVNEVGLAPGFYNGRLSGNFNSLPVYDVTESKLSPARWVEFVLTSALATTDASKSGCNVNAYWDGTQPGSTVIVHNMPSRTGNYVFSGVAGSHGYAVWDDILNRYRIVQLEC